MTRSGPGQRGVQAGGEARTGNAARGADTDAAQAMAGRRGGPEGAAADCADRADATDGVEGADGVGGAYAAVTADTAAPGVAADGVQGELLTRVLSTLLREDVCGLRTRSTVEDRPDGRWLRLRGPGRGGHATKDAGAQPEDLLLPVEEDGFQCEYAARSPLVVAGGRELTDGEEVVAAFARHAAAEDAPGFTAFAAEYRDALAALRLQAATGEETAARLTARHGGDLADWRGPDASLAFDVLAARRGHPLYPTSAARPGLTAEQLRYHAPEFGPEFTLRWLAVPQHAVTISTCWTPGPVPAQPAGTHESGVPRTGRALAPFWPAPSDLGLVGLDRTHLALPIHPLTAATAARGPLHDALCATGLLGRAVLAERPWPAAAPTLSMRTVALAAHPGVHLKLPLATATLGRLNRRTIKPGTLVDGAAAQRLLAAVTDREPRFQGLVLHCDETRWAHAGHELLAVLVRRLPPGLDGCTVLPLAALPATAPDGRLVADHLADRHTGGDPVALFDAVLTLLLDWQTTLFGYGIALESHQQNISLVLDDRPGAPRLRLLFKDDDGLRVNRRRLAETLGPGVPGPGGVAGPGAAGFDDPRITVDGDGPLVDLFTTITVHLCAGALAVALAGPDRVPLPVLLRLVRDRLAEATARLGDAPGSPGRTLRAALFASDRLPVKAMVTAGTLLAKERSGASDINKHYTSGPNYLLGARR